jgi:hypothetical protein
MPCHKSYSMASPKDATVIDACMQKYMPSGTRRPPRPGCSGKGGIIYDRDLITTWRLPNTLSAHQINFWEKAFQAALGQGTMLVVIEAFVEEMGPEICESQACSSYQKSADGIFCR